MHNVTSQTAVSYFFCLFHRICDLICYISDFFLPASRGYSRRLLKREVNRVRNISRQEALKLRPQTDNQSARTPFVITFNPALPNASATVRKNLNILHSSARCKQTFSPPPVVAYKRTPNLRDLLVRTQLRDNTNPQHKAPPGIYKCNHPRCLTCPFLQEGQAKYTFSATKEERCINDNLNRPFATVGHVTCFSRTH